MDENQTASVTAPTVGPPLVAITGCTAGAGADGSVTLTLYSVAAVSDFKSMVSVVAFSGLIPAAVAQTLLTNLDGAVMAAAKLAQKE